MKSIDPNKCRITEFNSQTNDIWLYRNLYLLAQATFSASEVVEVAIAITKGKSMIFNDLETLPIEIKSLL